MRFGRFGIASRNDSITILSDSWLTTWRCRSSIGNNWWTGPNRTNPVSLWLSNPALSWPSRYRPKAGAPSTTLILTTESASGHSAVVVGSGDGVMVGGGVG